MPTLTDEQRRQWAVDGYIHLKGALDPREVALYSGLIDSIRHVPGWEPTPDVPRGHYSWVECNPTADDPDSFMDRRDILGYGQPFLDIIGPPDVFDLILELMGPYIVLSMSQAIVRAPTTEFAGFTNTDGARGAPKNSGDGDQQAARDEGPVPAHRCRGNGLRQLHGLPRKPSSADSVRLRRRAHSPHRRELSSWAARPATATCSATRCGMGRRRITPGRVLQDIALQLRADVPEDV